MKRLPQGLLTLGLLIGASLATIAVAPTAHAGGNDFLFGMDAQSVAAQKNAGITPDVGTMWIGPWTLKSGWGGPDSAMRSMRDQGVTPAIHFYYWGDDISPSCVENGCWSSLHNAHKSKAGWQTLANQLTDHLNSQMQGREVIIFLETEFNKGGISDYEPFDGYLADKARFIESKYPNAKIVLAFGNWGSDDWHRFDRAAAASDYTGVQAMRGSTRDSNTEYKQAYEDTLTGVKKLKGLFGKQVLIHDLALSSYPESSYKYTQRDEMKQFFDNIGTLKANGATGLIYRSWHDNPKFALANYYKEAERHWGVAYADGKWKPSASVWVNGVKAERGGSTTSGGSTSGGSTSGGTFSASFTPSSGSNEWWVDVKVTGTKAISKVEAKVDSGSYQTLSKTSWGTFAKSMKAPKGSDVVFRATATDGTTATSGTYDWLVSTSGSSSSGGSSGGTSGGTFSATFSPRSSSNEWWIDVKVDGTKTISKVEAKVNGGGYTSLPKTSWGTWAKSVHAPKGSDVVFRATATDGTTATSGTYDWLVGGSATSGTSSGSTGAMTASFTPSSGSNEWWVDVKVDAGKTVSKVEVSVNGGGYTNLPKTSWGTWAKSLHVTKGTPVVFRATATDGSTASSGTISWLGSGPSSGSTSSSFDATFRVKDTTNNWWVEAYVDGKNVAKVEVRVDGGSWTTLPKTSWGAYAKSLHVADGGKVQLRATNGAGATDVSQTIIWS